MFRFSVILSVAALVSCGGDGADTQILQPVSQATGPVAGGATPALAEANTADAGNAAGQQEAASNTGSNGYTGQTSGATDSYAATSEPAAATPESESSDANYGYTDTGYGYSGNSNGSNDSDYGYSSPAPSPRPNNLVVEIEERNFITLMYGHANGFFYRSTKYYYPSDNNVTSAPADLETEVVVADRCEAFEIDFSVNPATTESKRFPHWEDAREPSSGPTRSLYDHVEERFYVGDSVRLLVNGEPSIEIPYTDPSYYAEGYQLPGQPMTVAMDTPGHIDTNNFVFPLVENIVITRPSTEQTWLGGEAIIWNGSEDPDSVMTITRRASTTENGTRRYNFSCELKDDGEFVLPPELLTHIAGWPAAGEWDFVREVKNIVVEGDATYKSVITTRSYY